MRVLTLIIFTAGLLLVSLGYANAKDFEVTKAAGPYEVTATIDRNQPVVGENNIAIKITEGGKQVTGADVIVAYSMPAMPGMPAMSYKAAAKADGAEYKAVMGISMAGPWNVSIRITKDGKTSSVKFNIDAR